MLRIYYTIKKKRKLYFSNFLPIYLSIYDLSRKKNHPIDGKKFESIRKKMDQDQWKEKFFENIHGQIVKSYRQIPMTVRREKSYQSVGDQPRVKHSLCRGAHCHLSGKRVTVHTLLRPWRKSETEGRNRMINRYDRIDLRTSLSRILAILLLGKTGIPSEGK